MFGSHVPHLSTSPKRLLKRMSWRGRSVTARRPDALGHRVAHEGTSACGSNASDSEFFSNRLEGDTSRAAWPVRSPAHCGVRG